jgi:hypothetical protein
VDCRDAVLCEIPERLRMLQGRAIRSDPQIGWGCAGLSGVLYGLQRLQDGLAFRRPVRRACPRSVGGA